MDDFQLVQRCLEGEEEALRHLQTTCGGAILSFLVNKGASSQEAEEIVSQLWADCLVANHGETARIARYDGSCKLITWLNTVAVNRLISIKRRQQRVRMESLESPAGDGEDARSWETILGTTSLDDADVPLVELLVGAIEAGFRACSPEQFVILQLAHGDGLKLVELARIWNCNPGTISRRLNEAREAVQKAALNHIQRQDGWLHITWDDFMHLCRSANLGALGF